MTTETIAKKRPKTSTPRGLAALVEMAPAQVPVSYIDTAKGAKAAEDAVNAALEGLAQMQIALAARELLAHFSKNPNIAGFVHSVESAGDDEGHYWLEIHSTTEFVDGSEWPNHDYGDDEEDNESQHDALDALVDSLMDRFPLARKHLEDSRLNPDIVKKLIPPAFAARQEALAIDRATKAAAASAAPAARL